MSSSAQYSPGALRVLELLRRHDYAELWRLHENRTSRTDGPIARCRTPEWRGEPLAGKHLLVFGEQGMGDEIQFGRFVPRLKALGARVTAAVLPANRRLYAQQVGADDTLDRVETQAFQADYVVGLLSLPYRLQCHDEASLGRAAYLTAPEPRRTGGVGVVWRGEPRHPNDANRSMRSPDLLMSLPGAQLIEPEGDAIDSLNRLAGLDALVTVDTSWAHLAGALGLPCHILLPFISPDWRWEADRSDSPWYGSVRLHRQPEPGAWEPLVADVRAALPAR
jgi:hypothetical protein